MAVVSRRQPVPPPPTPDDPEGDPGHRPHLSAHRRDYRVLWNGFTHRVQSRWLFFWWQSEIDAPSYEWADRWIREHMRRAQRRSAKWQPVTPYAYPPLAKPLPPPPPPPAPNPRVYEVCVCAAIKLPDGYIVRGHRHHDCLRSAGEMARFKGVKGGDVVQGFLTTHERFVDRDEGLRLQLVAGRHSINPTGDYGTQLYSEDLY